MYYSYIPYQFVKNICLRLSAKEEECCYVGKYYLLIDKFNVWRNKKKKASTVLLLLYCIVL